LLGAEVLRRFDIVIDYPASTVYLRPNANFHSAWIEDVTGIRLLATAPDFRQKKVGDVFQHSAADAAGVRPGDEITSINGIRAADLTVEQIMRLFRTAAVVRMTLVRDGKTVEAAMRPQPPV
jgi:C-terminal processing protease CtpA/Prc